jgi:adenylate cyclase
MAQRDMNEAWRRILTGGDPWLAWGRRFLGRLPSAPRCKLCASPFGRPGVALMRLLGKRRWELNPWLCNICARKLGKKVGGAEVEISLLFADLRGSTTIAEQLPAEDFAELLNRFYDAVAAVVDRNGGLVDKLIGDGVLALFIPGFSDADHARHAIDAGRELLSELSNQAPGQIPVGVGVHTGLAYVGVVGSGTVLDFTAVGDTTNIVARLGSAAGPGELLVSEAAAHAGKLSPDGFDQRHLEVKGRVQPLGVWVLQRHGAGRV